MTGKDALWLGVLAGGAYLVYSLIQGVKGAAGAATAAVGSAFTSASSGIASAAEALFPHGATILAPGASIVLPTGETISTAQALGQGSFTALDGSTQIQFYYNGRTWRTTAQPDETNTYYAA